GPPTVCSVEGPARGHAIALGDLVVDLEPQIREQRLVEGHRFTRARVAVEDHLVDVIDELLVVELRQPVQLPGAYELEGAAGDGRGLGRRLSAHVSDSSARSRLG